MFARIWRGIARTSVVEKYFHYVNERVIPAYRAASGCRDVRVLRQPQDEFTSIILLSFWESRDALDAFADPQLKSESLRGERESLLAFESTAAAYEVIVVD